MKVSRITKNGKPCWRVAFTKDGKECRRFFPSRQVAEAFARQAGHELETLGAVWFAATADQRNQMVEAWRRSQAGGYTLAEACEAIERRRPQGSFLTLGKAVSEFCAFKRSQGLRPRSLRGLTSSVEAFARGRSEMSLSEITPPMVAAHVNRPEWSARTRSGVLVDLGTLFGWAVRMEYLDRNPVAKVPRPVIERGAKCVHRAEQVERILRTCEQMDPELISYAALGYFAGLRPESELERLPRANIGQEHVRIDFWNKTRRSRDVTIRPNLAAWLARWRDLGSPVFPVDAHRRWRRVRKAAGFTSREQDVMRHTFVSAHYVLHGEAATVREAGHSAEELHASYRALLTRAEAEAVFAIMPRPEPYAGRASGRALDPERARSMARKRWATPPTPPDTPPGSPA